MTDEVEVPVTPLDLVLSMTVTVNNTKAWALAKADSIEKRIADAGGEPSADLKQALDELRAAAA